jgi:hypothetical protein
MKKLLILGFLAVLMFSMTSSGFAALTPGLVGDKATITLLAAPAPTFSLDGKAAVIDQLGIIGDKVVITMTLEETGKPVTVVRSALIVKTEYLLPNKWKEDAGKNVCASFEYTRRVWTSYNPVGLRGVLSDYEDVLYFSKSPDPTDGPCNIIG